MQRHDVRLDSCLKCSYCNTACPLLRVYPDYPGPKRLGPEWERMRREGIDADTEWVEYCLGCGQCDLICPNQVKVSELIAEAKAEHKKEGKHKIRDFMLSRPGLLGKLGSAIPPLANMMLGQQWNRSLMSHFMDISSARKLPAYRTRRLGALHEGNEGNEGKERILFFPGCYVQFNNPDVGTAAVEVLRINGFAVDVAATGCCGLPCIANGDREELLKNVQNNIQAMEQAVESGYRIVTACPSCGHTLKAHYPHLCDGKDRLKELADKIAASTYDLGELLSSLKSEGRMDTKFQSLNMKLAYHAPCHTKSQGIGKPWLELLGEIPGIEITDMDAGCCGMAGTYGFKKEKYQISMEIGQELFDKLRDHAPETVVTECATCQLQIGHGTGLRTSHPVEILYHAYNR